MFSCLCLCLYLGFLIVEATGILHSCIWIWWLVIIFGVCSVPLFRTCITLPVLWNGFRAFSPNSSSCLPESPILSPSLLQSLNHLYVLASLAFLIYFYCPLFHQRISYLVSFWEHFQAEHSAEFINPVAFLQNLALVWYTGSSSVCRIVKAESSRDLPDSTGALYHSSSVPLSLPCFCSRRESGIPCIL